MEPFAWIEQNGERIANAIDAPLSEVRFFRAPGRINLIGEHTDYNEGFVLPVAIDRQVIIAARERQDRSVHVHSLNFHESDSFDLDETRAIRHGYWLNYIEGTCRVLERRGYNLCGADLAIESDVPIGGGLSSSAAVETATATTMLTLAGTPLDRVQMAMACQQAEHEYSGAQVGIMDQFISANGRENAALLLDCRSLESREVGVNTNDHRLIVCNTGVKHDLGTSEYNLRRQQCEQAARMLFDLMPSNGESSSETPTLRQFTFHDFESYKHALPIVLQKRARHVITENMRTLNAAAALDDSDFELMGRLMYASHESLRYDYEVSCPELDAVVDASREIAGVAGTRMTGGGFGGCTVSFVRPESVVDFKRRISEEYIARTGHMLTIYECEIVRGAEEILL